MLRVQSRLGQRATDQRLRRRLAGAAVFVVDLEEDEHLLRSLLTPGQRILRSSCVVNPFSVTSSGGAVVLMEDPAQAIAALDRPGRQWDHFGWLTGSALLDPLMGSGVVLMVDELGKDLLQVPAAQDQHGPAPPAVLSPPSAPNRRSPEAPGTVTG